MTTKSILLVEDDESDAYLIERAFRSLQFEYKLEITTDGSSALKLLEGCSSSSDLPELILLDLHMPGMNGI